MGNAATRLCVARRVFARIADNSTLARLQRTSQTERDSQNRQTARLAQQPAHYFGHTTSAKLDAGMLLLNCHFAGLRKTVTIKRLCIFAAPLLAAEPARTSGVEPAKETTRA